MEAIEPAHQRALESALLRRQIAYVHAESPFYRRRFAAAGLRPSDIKTPEDLARLPFTTKAELREAQARVPPFGDYLGAPPERIVRVHRTSGSTGRFIYLALTERDLANTAEVGARAFWAAGLRPQHRVVHCLNYCLWMGGLTDHLSLERTGATVLPFGVGNSAQLVRIIHEAGVDAISCTPSYPRVLEAVVREELGIEPRELGLRLGLFGGEPGLENPAFKTRLEETWGLRARNANYGVTDILSHFASVVEEEDVLHYFGQGVVLAQLVDPASGAPVAIEEGARGELVGTNLVREAQPLVRYRTGDVLEIGGVGRSRSGRTGFRFRMVGRADDMVHVRGINVFPSGIAMVLDRLVPTLTGAFQIVLDAPPPYDHLPITVEHGAHVRPEDYAGLAAEVARALRAALGFTARPTLVGPGAIPLSEMGKAIRVRRTYDGDAMESSRSEIA